MQSVAQFRHHMIDGQLEPNQVLDPRIIAAMGCVPREAFVPAAYAQSAYLDDQIPLGNHAYLLSPLLLGKLLQAASPLQGESVLVLGDSSGYCAALLAAMGCNATLLIESQELASHARLTLNQAGFASVGVHSGALEMGWSAGKPYHKMIVCGAIGRISTFWSEQLSEGGSLTYIAATTALPSSDEMRGAMTVATWANGQWVSRTSDDVACPILPSLMPKGGFHFD